MLFIYGTLREGAKNRSKVKGLLSSSQSAATLGSLYLSGKYPLLLKAGGTRIVGELVELVDEAEAFNILDPFEGREYKRAQIDVTTESGEKKVAWAYLYREDSPPDDAIRIDSGDWLEYSKSK
ncbi:hypothetical protein A2763_02385 [Candidatus Kaiserbacteria bacterium RIFCSPHIGHO2_01_FULL_54_36]|uniref:Gamma-glutamylcyclotransferase AIG2-like domain-containing protein n=1 Tax=Candidatus Kaiserbacteria bacterium RIFCSPHIGHO2_01_FULL_54_36 TaxID=1798482 RepID=A0A1F6CNH1_9BACT|nr:MAG: hypothetical protein A2763_02385 [Candidatus Kaiserbacteria bacterium RIFCSPHIGHO2_01_FULL_54_36]OGG76007.1 MAG: hypothetical protein A3A41_03490 [Candidatus Kaiserbacteria bacterium RIFCSPLOWO2_01_FULL_54_22]